MLALNLGVSRLGAFLPMGKAITQLGIPLNEWVFILIIIYTALQITFFLRDRLIKPWLHRRVNQNANVQKGKSQS
ncbi:hypothetical protein ACO0LC_15665 [Undibacterium sp. JH2W]|uniref:hypothetical protein n=1 Tax=Undibacterium sp. JH2W TaxID=3413037 RepID=UPI003BEFF29E